MAIVVSNLTSFDIPRAMELVEIAQWNQLPSDWLRVLEYDREGSFVARLDGILVGTVTTIRYASELAWIGMMLVRPNARRRGIGKGLMIHAIDYLRGRGVASIMLDATPMGRPLYELLGFQVHSQWHRWHRDEMTPQRQPTAPASPPSAMHSNAPFGPFAESLRPLDTIAFGADRWFWIQSLACVSKVESAAKGYGMLRNGRLASYLGPVVSEDIELAQRLVAKLLDPSPAACFWDIPSGNESAEELATRHGFSRVRTLYRMHLGEVRNTCHPPHQYAIADPATG